MSMRKRLSALVLTGMVAAPALTANAATNTNIQMSAIKSIKNDLNFFIVQPPCFVNCTFIIKAKYVNVNMQIKKRRGFLPRLFVFKVVLALLTLFWHNAKFCNKINFCHLNYCFIKTKSTPLCVKVT